MTHPCFQVCADTIVGSHIRRGISGGQKKRVTTGEIVVGPCKVLLMDEISVRCLGFARVSQQASEIGSGRWRHNVSQHRLNLVHRTALRMCAQFSCIEVCMSRETGNAGPSVQHWDRVLTNA